MYRFEFMTMRQIGKWLVEIGLRTPENRPSCTAFEGEFASQGPSRGSGYNWCWASAQTVSALEQAGHRRIPNPPLWLVDPPRLCGPFERRANDKNGYDVVNADGSVSIVASGGGNVEFLVKLLNIAHRNGVVERWLGMPEIGGSADHLAM
jgi:hypothetical protein